MICISLYGIYGILPKEGHNAHDRFCNQDGALLYVEEVESGSRIDCQAIDPQILLDFHDDLQQSLVSLPAFPLTHKDISILCYRAHYKRKMNEELYAYVTWDCCSRAVSFEVCLEICNTVLQIMRSHFSEVPNIHCIFYVPIDQYE